MGTFIGVWFFLVIAIACTTAAYTGDFWNDYKKCAEKKDNIPHEMTMQQANERLHCLRTCFFSYPGGNTETLFEECFDAFLIPYYKVYRGKDIPSEKQINDCVHAKNRGNCKDVMFYYLMKQFKDKTKKDYSKNHGYMNPLHYAYVDHPDFPQDVVVVSNKDILVTLLSWKKFDTPTDIENTKKFTVMADTTKYPEIQAEIDHFCYQYSDDPFRERYCTLVAPYDITKKMHELAKNKGKYVAGFNKYLKAIALNMAVVSADYPSSYQINVMANWPREEKDKIKLIDENLDELFSLFKKREIQEISKLLTFLPELYLLRYGCKTTHHPVFAKRICILLQVQGQLTVYTRIWEKRQKSEIEKRKIVDYTLNLKEMLKEIRTERTLQLLHELKETTEQNNEHSQIMIERKFQQLRGYFDKMQGFNMQKADADISYINGTLNFYKDVSERVQMEAGNNIGEILNAAFLASGLEVAYNVVKLTATILEAANPLKTVFNGGTFTDIMEATSDLVNSIATMVGATRRLLGWSEIADELIGIGRKFAENSAFLIAVGKLIESIKVNSIPDEKEFEQQKTLFLEKYTAYTPAVTKLDLGRIEEKLTITVEETCAVFDEVESFTANAAVIDVKNRMICDKAKVSVKEMVTANEEIYDFQFQLIDSMAEYMSAATAYQASSKMVVLSDQPLPSQDVTEEDYKFLRININTAEIAYELQKLQAIQGYCDFLTYKEGGRTPGVCTGATVSIETLVTYNGRACKSAWEYYDVPVKQAGSSGPGTLDLEALYASKEVSFRIPDYNWLKKHKWIEQDDVYEAIYVKDIQVFLPTVSHRSQKVNVDILALGSNVLKPGDIDYTLIPMNAFDFEYQEGSSYLSCGGVQKDNPYNICGERKLPDVCILTDEVEPSVTPRLYPSIFSEFKLEVDDYKADQHPVPTTPLAVQFRLKLCKFKLRGRRRVHKRSTPARPGCCPVEKYWAPLDNVCKTCPTSSKANLNGYYCESNDKAMMLNT